MKLLDLVGMVSLLITVTESRQTLTGLVTDSAGAVLEDAIIIIHPDGSSSDGTVPKAPEDLKIKPDHSGKYMAELTPRIYCDLLVSRAGFQPQCRKLYIPSTGGPVEVNFMLKIDTSCNYGMLCH